MFSRTTIESSTRMPIVSESPISEMMSSVKLQMRITMKVASSEHGIAIMTTSALRQACRKSISTIAVRMIPSTRLCSTPLSEALRVVGRRVDLFEGDLGISLRDLRELGARDGGRLDLVGA